MRKTIIAITLLLFAVSCGERKDYLRTGDLVFVGLPLDYSLDSTSMDAAIAAATGVDGLNLIHVAIAEVQGDSTWIIDATIAHGVDRHPLDTFFKDFTLKDGTLPEFIVKRVSGVDASAAVERAKSFCGQPYDVYFLADNGAMYCSELVQNSYLDASGKPVFDSVPMNWAAPDGTIPIYWEQLFGLLGMEVPQGAPGTNPQEMFDSDHFENVQVQTNW